MKKVLIITYYWPPTGGSGVQRWLKMSKYLPENGWKPIVYTPENPEGGAVDESLLKDVVKEVVILKKKIWEPFEIYKTITRRKKHEMIGTGFLSEKKSESLTEKLSVWIRGNMFIPDARKFWIRPSIIFLSKYLLNNSVDIIISTGPPHSMHLIAHKISEKFSIPWIADFRDPWTGIDFYDKLHMTKWADKQNRKMENAVLNRANKVITVNWNLANELKKISGRNVDVVTNGFDPDDYSFINKSQISDKFSICHLGSMNKDRNHEIFWQALSQLCNEVTGFKNNLSVELIGATDISVREMVKNYNLTENVEYVKFANHENAITKAAASQILFLPLNHTPNAMGITPTKLFEYLALYRPILCIGPENGDAATIINQSGSGVVVDFNNKEKLHSILQKYFDSFMKKGKLITETKNIEQYSRQMLAKKVVGLFNELL